MPTDKDFKRLVRTRMTKTGEAYTTARAHLLASHTRHAAPTRPTGTPIDLAALAGTSDASVRDKTGCGWDKWVYVLDKAEAHSWPHRDIAAWVTEQFGLSGWWAQTVTVGYERIKGLRVIGQRRDGDFEATKTRTFPVPVRRLYRAWRDKRVRHKWLPEPITVRMATPDKSIRITWADGTFVSLWFTAKTPSRSSVQVQHAKLTSTADAARRKAFWHERLDDLGALLTD